MVLLPGSRRLPPAVNELKGVDADVVFFAGLEALGGRLHREPRTVGVKTDIVEAFSNTPEMRQRPGAGWRAPCISRCIIFLLPFFFY